MIKKNSKMIFKNEGGGQKPFDNGLPWQNIRNLISVDKNSAE